MPGMSLKSKREPFARCVNNSTDFFYEASWYIKRAGVQPLFAVRGNTTRVVVTENGEPVCQLARELLHGSFRTFMMQRLFLVLFAVEILIPGSARAWPGQAEPKKEQAKKGQPKTASKGKTTASMTGCIDEQQGHYVLLDDRALSQIAELEADGFPPESFAKHLGHKVTVRGIGSTGGTRPLFKVRTIETVSETCAPQPAEQKEQ
jgi:hypothetical protein